MLYIDLGKLNNSQERFEVQWYIGEPVPDLCERRVVKFQADGDELELILEAMKRTGQVAPLGKSTPRLVQILNILTKERGLASRLHAASLIAEMIEQLKAVRG